MPFKIQPNSGRMLGKLSVFLALSLSVGAGWQAYNTHLQAQQLEREWATLSRAELGRLAGNYLVCITEAQQIASGSIVGELAQTVEQMCQDALAQSMLKQSKESAANDQMERAIGQANRIPPDSSYYQEAQQLIEEWAVSVLALAERHYLDPTGQLSLAVTTAKSIPERCSLYPIAQQKMQEWQQTWDTNQERWRSAQFAVGINDLDAATTALAQVVEHPYWAIKVQTLVDQINAKHQQYQTILSDAQQQLRQGNLEQATRIVSQLPEIGSWGQKRAELANKIEVAYQEREKSELEWVSTVVGAVVLVIEILAGVGRR